MPIPELAQHQSRLVQTLHQADAQFVIAVTGGGSGAISRWLEIPGGSLTLLEARVPYAAAALADFLGNPPEQACCAFTAGAMAMAAFTRACWLTQQQSLVAARPTGLAATASLATTRPKRGPHRAHLAAQTVQQSWRAHLQLEKGRRTRLEEEDLVSCCLLALAAMAANAHDSNPAAELLWPRLLPPDQLSVHSVTAPAAWQQLLTGQRLAVDARELPVDSLSQPHSKSGQPAQAVFSGAFNPLHAGHRKLMEVAAARLGVQPVYEMCVRNVDKPPLDYCEMQTRLDQFAPSEQVWFSTAATFVEKSQAYPGAVFLVGADTIARVADPHYYGASPAQRDAAIAALAQRGCRFLVFGRKHQGQFTALSNLSLPGALAALCDEVSESEFHEDISSTELRHPSDPNGSRSRME